MRTFIVVGHRARTDGNFSLDDLPGSAGRMDILCRCIQASLFLSHTLRRDVDCLLILQGEPEPPKTILFKGSEVQYLNPDERSAGSLIKKALAMKVGTVFRHSTPGVYIRATGLETLLLDHHPAVADEDGTDIRHVPNFGTSFLLSDHLNFTSEELRLLQSQPRFTVGPRSLHADHVITVINNEMDRREAGWK